MKDLETAIQEHDREQDDEKTVGLRNGPTSDRERPTENSKKDSEAVGEYAKDRSSAAVPLPVIPTVDLSKGHNSSSPIYIPGLLIRERIERCEVCNQKKVERAQTQWAQRRYPAINWSDLSNRVEKYIPWLTEYLKRRDVPLFRKEYTKVRSRFEYEDFLINNPRSGYHGPRGEDIITSHLMDRMSPVFRSAARHNPVVEKSPVQYMMQALVPAIVVRLIMEDMRQDEVAALETLKNGTSLGMFFHEEVDESW